MIREPEEGRAVVPPFSRKRGTGENECVIGSARFLSQVFLGGETHLFCFSTPYIFLCKYEREKKRRRILADENSSEDHPTLLAVPPHPALNPHFTTTASRALFLAKRKYRHCRNCYVILHIARRKKGSGLLPFLFFYWSPSCRGRVRLCAV